MTDMDPAPFCHCENMEAAHDGNASGTPSNLTRERARPFPDDFG
ncbi:hypothetical protein [Nocardiopsis sp. CNR-923]|nr:hypothetical protein [Nocardiopsis sp. CNR-923]